MNKVIASLLLSAICAGQAFAAALDAPSPTADPSDVATLEKIEQDLGDAMKAADVKWASQFHASDWVTVGSGGKVFTKDMFLQDLKTGSIKLDDFKLGPMNVQVFANTATVQGSATEKRSRNGKDVSGQFVWLDVFEKRAGKWVIVASTGGRVK
jgi:ketosteroid isomerase-like protein